MNKSNLWSLRLGFSSKQASAIEQLGIENFLKKSMLVSFPKELPKFLVDEPKTLAEFKEVRQQIKSSDSDEQKKNTQKANQKFGRTKKMVDW